jgi:hypothetical protein
LIPPGVTNDPVPGEDQNLLVTTAGRTTLRVASAIVLVAASVSIAYMLDWTPDAYHRPPNNLDEFAHLTAAYLNARNMDEYQVIRATVGQQQC